MVENTAVLDIDIDFHFGGLRTGRLRCVATIFNAPARDLGRRWQYRRAISTLRMRPVLARRQAAGAHAPAITGVLTVIVLPRSSGMHLVE